MFKNGWDDLIYNNSVDLTISGERGGVVPACVLP